MLDSFEQPCICRGHDTSSPRYPRSSHTGSVKGDIGYLRRWEGGRGNAGGAPVLQLVARLLVAGETKREVGAMCVHTKRANMLSQEGRV